MSFMVHLIAECSTADIHSFTLRKSNLQPGVTSGMMVAAVFHLDPCKKHHWLSEKEVTS